MVISSHRKINRNPLLFTLYDHYIKLYRGGSSHHWILFLFRGWLLDISHSLPPSRELKLSPRWGCTIFTNGLGCEFVSGIHLDHTKSSLYVHEPSLSCITLDSLVRILAFILLGFLFLLLFFMWSMLFISHCNNVTSLL